MTLPEAYYDDVTVRCDGPVTALLGIDDFDEVFACLGDADRVRIELYGDPDDRFATELQIHAGETTVRFDELPGETYLADVPERMPEIFDGGRFHLRDGTLAPTVVETTAESLSRLVDAIDGSTYPVVVTEEGPMLDVGRRGMSARAQLPGRLVEGPTVENRYGEAFARAVRTMEGRVRLETVPDGPLAIVRDAETHTGRLVVPSR